MGLLTIVALLCAPQGAPAPAAVSGAGQPVAATTVTAEAPAEIVLLGDQVLGPVAFGLGTGGVGKGPHDAPLRTAFGACTTPGGIGVRTLREGVLLRFPGGGELLFAPDGHLHLRTGERAGPFLAGAEFWLADGARLRVTRTGSRRDPVQEVIVVAGEQATRLWERNRGVLEDAPLRPWLGPRLLCGGDGTTIYRAIAVGPLVTMERLLLPTGTGRDLPARRIGLFVEPLLHSLAALPEQNGRFPAELDPALRAVRELDRRARAVFDPKARPPRRVEQDEARFALSHGYELTFRPEPGSRVRLGLHVGQQREPFVEWSIGLVATLNLLHPERVGGEAGRYWGRPALVPPVAPDLRARAELFELGPALDVVRALVR